jgi:hypothetical protein
MSPVTLLAFSSVLTKPAALQGATSLDPDND